MKNYLLKFLEPLPVMWFLFFIGLLVGLDTIIGLTICSFGGFFGSLLLVEEISSKRENEK